MTKNQTKQYEQLKQQVAQAIFDKFIDGDSYGFGTWEDFQDEAEAAIKAYEAFYAKKCN